MQEHNHHVGARYVSPFPVGNKTLFPIEYHLYPEIIILFLSDSVPTFKFSVKLFTGIDPLLNPCLKKRENNLWKLSFSSLLIFLVIL